MLKTLSFTPAAAVVAEPAALEAISVYDDAGASLSVVVSVLGSVVVAVVAGDSLVEVSTSGFVSAMIDVCRFRLVY